MRQKTDVLIVGAGPTGLAAAAELTRLGVSARIIDKNNARTDKSKALGVQAGTLEVLAATLGEDLAQKMIATGLPMQTAVVRLFEAAPIRVDLSQIPSRFNFVLCLPQSETERLLEEHLSTLGGQVERGTELLALKQNSDTIVGTLRTGEEIEARFIIGADGAHSIVRHQLNIPFVGGSYQGDFLLGDVTLKWELEPSVVHAFNGEKGLLLALPIDRSGRYRLIVAPRRPTLGAGVPELTLTEFANTARAICPVDIQFAQSFWLSRFSIHHRITEHFQVGRAFVAGDAAHIHSPVGGQGMNTGIQDALNLSDKLAAVLKQKAPLASLKQYELQRHPIAAKIVRNTDLATRFGFVSSGMLTRFMRRNFAPVVLRNHAIQRILTRGMSQVRIARQEIESRRETLSL